jgi:hypothetical protein
MQRYLACWTAAVVGVGTGCRESAGPGDCTGDVIVEVTEGATPEFGWSPACEVASLAVFSAADVMWSIHSGVGRNALVPPVRYGEVPRGSVEETSAAPLQHGFGYFVRVFRLDRDGEELIQVEAGEATFRH